jgi:glycosyltransferase involved in cell wall biosynthesis
MRIAEIAPPWLAVPPRGYGGIELVVAALASGLDARGHDVTLFAPKGSTSEADVVSPLHPAGPELIGNPWYEAHHAVTAFMRHDEFDILHNHTFLGTALGAALPEAPPVVHTLHGAWTPEARRYYDLVEGHLELVAISEAQRRANEGIRYAATIPNGIDLARYPMGQEQRDDFLVYIGRAKSDKAPDEAIELARRVGRPLKLVCKQAEPEEVEYWNEVVEPLLGPDIEVLPEVGHEEKLELLQRGFAFVFPIRWEEPFGLVVIEAMACGMPVVARPRGAVADIVIDGETGFLDDDLDRLADAIERVGEISPSACRARVEECYSSDTMVAAYEDLFVRLADGGRAR